MNVAKSTFVFLLKMAFSLARLTVSSTWNNGHYHEEQFPEIWVDQETYVRYNGP